jgi:hypothetical protein
LANRPGPYPQRMLIDQFTYLQGMLSRADQRVGRDAYTRYEDEKVTRTMVRQSAPRSHR